MTPLPSSHREASALVVTLAFITILTIILLAYFNIVTMDRQATRNYTQGLKAETVARGAMAFVVGELRAEMAQGDSPLAVGEYSVFTNVDSTNILPEQIGADPAVPSLIKLPGSGEGVFSGATAIATDSNSSQPSANGRRVATGRWSRPGLGQLTAAPHWFLLGPGGVTTTPAKGIEGRFACAVYDVGALLDINVAGFPSSLSAAQQQAIGGTLAGLDLTGLGLDQTQVDDLIENFRNRTSAADYTNHVLNVSGTNGYMVVESGDDTILGRQDLLDYAKAKGISSALPYFTTFTRTVNSPAWRPTINGPKFNVQSITRSSVVPFNPQDGASVESLPVEVEYKDDAASANATNRSFLTEAVAAPFTRVDDSEAVVGEPLVKTRFALRRLAWLSKDGPSQIAKDRFGSDIAAAAKIKQAFGLVWDSGNRLWVYTSPTSSGEGGDYTSGNSDGPASSGKAASTIKTLAVVATENREPDFFELLQAGILKGSLGQHSSIVDYNGAPQPGEVTSQGHIFQIGANIIDQYDEDDFPTLIRAYMPTVMDGSKHFWNRPYVTSFVMGTGSGGLTPHDFAGVENLPYLMSFRTRAYRVQTDNSADGTRRYGEAILMPQFWNPHANAASPSSDRPTQLRMIQTFGEIRMTFMGVKRGSTAGTVFVDSLTGDLFGYQSYQTSPPSAWPSSTGDPQPRIEFSSATTFAQPGFLTPSLVTGTSRPEHVQEAIETDSATRPDIDPAGFVGFWLGSAPAHGTAVEADDPLDEDADNTAIDRGLWAQLTGGDKIDCPVQQSILSVATPGQQNSTPLPSSDPFWKGDTALAVYNQRNPVFELQYLDGTEWKTYQRFDGLLRGGGADHKWDTYTDPDYAGVQAKAFACESHNSIYGHIDPRTSRFGLVRMVDPDWQYNGSWDGNPHSYRNVPLASAEGTTGRPTGAASVTFSGNAVPGNQGGAQFTDTFDPSNQWARYPLSEWQNNTSTGQRYTDNDRILRRADGNTSKGVDLLAASSSARPVMLNRPFESPADLGYVFRDLPFKTLDFFSEDSADAGLLDLFSVEETPSVVAGKLNLNGRNAEVMARVLSGVVVDETSASKLSTSKASSVGNALLDASAVDAFTGLWTLPGFLESPDFQGAATGDLADVKTHSEAIVRRLAALADTRCWNLLIDVVAQAGRFAPGVTDPDQFTVEGERRYWLKIAIDRFTGEVVSRQIEPVYE